MYHTLLDDNNFVASVAVDDLPTRGGAAVAASAIALALRSSSFCLSDA